MTDGLPMWTIYKNPLDYPDRFVLRRCVVGRGGILHDADPVLVTHTLAQARAAVPVWCVCLGRNPADEPQIVEVWI
jgi:hypothetical protein